MGLLNLCILAVPLMREKLISRYRWIQIWTWGYLLVAVLSALLAPVSYLYLPTEWSAYMSVLSSVIQVAITWQIAVLADRKSLENIEIKRQ